MGWINQLFERRMLPLRLLITLACGVGYLAQLRPATALRPADWILALAAVAATAAGSRWPLGTVLVQATLLGTAGLVGATMLIPIKVAASIAIFELAIYRSGWALLVGWGAMATVYATRVVSNLPADLGPVLYRVTVLIGLPLLLGAYLRSMRREAQQAMRRVAEEQRRRASELKLLRVNERTAIARELHDLVAHHIASMVLRVGVARHVLPFTDPEVRDVLDDIHASGSATLADLRRLVALLRSAEGGHDEHRLVDPSRLPGALADLVTGSRKVGLRVDTSVDPQIATVDAVRGLAVLRIVQEGLTNVAKHAGPAACVSLTVKVDGSGAVSITIRDNGGTGEKPVMPDGLGQGLIGMRERVQLLGGRLDAASVDGGWRLNATLPAPVQLSESLA